MSAVTVKVEDMDALIRKRVVSVNQRMARQEGGLAQQVQALNAEVSDKLKTSDQATKKRMDDLSGDLKRSVPDFQQAHSEATDTSNRLSEQLSAIVKREEDHTQREAARNTKTMQGVNRQMERFQEVMSESPRTSVAEIQWLQTTSSARQSRV